MSIIHDALKKVQKNLSSRADKKSPDTSIKPNESSAYLYATPPVEILSETILSNPKPKPILGKIIKFTLILMIALAIIGGSIYYFYLQFNDNLPSAPKSAVKSIRQLIPQKTLPDLNIKKMKELRPLAQIIIKQAKTSLPNAAPPPEPITLKIHGIMSNASGNLALINNQVYQEGDKIDGITIIKINLNSIKISANGKEKTIPVDN